MTVRIGFVSGSFLFM